MKSALEYPPANSRGLKEQTRRKTGRGEPRRKAITRILVPIDFSRRSFQAVSHALAISRRFGAEVHLVHVIDATEYLPPTVLVWPAVLQREWENQVENHLKRLAVHYSKQKEVTSHAPLKGCAYKEICRAARQMRADLIIISTHGYTGSKRVFLGSTAERVIQFSPCPVLVVRKAYSEKSAAKGRGRPFRVDKILIPIDFSPFSECALELGASLARDLGAKVSLVHALNLPGYPLNDRQTATPAALLITEMRKMARKKIQEMAARARLSGTAEVVEGSPTMAICGYAAAADVDLIIISTHGRSGLKHALLGSVAERVVRHADCPVLVLPARWATKTPQPK